MALLRERGKNICTICLIIAALLEYNGVSLLQRLFVHSEVFYAMANSLADDYDHARSLK